MLLKCPTGLKSVKAWHVDVEHHDIRVYIASCTQGLSAIGGRSYLLEVIGQCCRRPFENATVVIDEKDPWLRGTTASHAAW